MTYDERPWLKNYDEWIDPDFIPEQETLAKKLDEVFADYPSRAAIHYMGTTITFREMESLSNRFAAMLAELGMGPGDVVGINLPNLPQFLIAYAGTLRAGCAATGISPLLSPKEMAYQLNDCKAKILVTLDVIYAERVVKIKDKVPDLTHIVTCGIADYLTPLKRFLGKALKKIPTAKVEPINGKTVMSFLDLMKTYPDRKPQVEIKPEHNCLIQYTGGTTGMPKGTELTHYNLIANGEHFKQWMDMSMGTEVFISAFPFFHLAGLYFGSGGLTSGNPQILVPDPRNTDHFCKEFEKYKPTMMANVPSLYQMLLENPKFRDLDFEGVKYCFSGAAPFAVESLKALEAVVGKNKVMEAYGMTETSPLMTANPAKGRKKVGSVGVPLQSTYVRLVDLDEGKKQVPLGEAGELIVRGPQVMKGYYNKPEETAHAKRELDGEVWLYTGDVAKMDEDGFFYIVDRSKDMIIVSGYKVFSKEAEETLYAHPAVELCAIVGMEDPKRPGNERVKAVIQLSTEYKGKDHEQVKKDIIDYCRENMAPYKVPKIVEFVDELPLTAIGKVDKKVLR